MEHVTERKHWEDGEMPPRSLLTWLSEQLCSSRFSQNCAGTQRRTGGLLWVLYTAANKQFSLQSSALNIPAYQGTGLLERISHSIPWGEGYGNSWAEKKLAWTLTSAPLVSFMGAACSRACDSIDKVLDRGKRPTDHQGGTKNMAPVYRIGKAKQHGGIQVCEEYRLKESRTIKPSTSIHTEALLQGSYW